MLAQLQPTATRLLGRSASWVRDRRQFTWAVMAAVIAFVIVIVALAHAARRVPLFDAPLTSGQMQEVEQALILWGEPYEVGAQGDAIEVAPARKRELLLRLFMAGLPRRSAPTSADVLQSGENPLTPETVIDDRRRAGIEGDLVTSLRRIAGVADASVFIAPSTAGPLDDPASKVPPSASVQIIAQANAALSAATVLGIQRFVAAAYPGLSADRVTVVDSNGAVMGGTLETDRAASKELRLQIAVQSALDAVLGPGSAVVRVTARTRGSAVAVEATRVIPHGLLEADVGRERGNESGRTLEKVKASRRYAYDTVVERHSTPADSITHLSVAVFLDSSRVDPAKRPVIEALVRAAAGADLEAGDEVVVRTLAFAPKPRAAGPPAGRMRLRWIVAALVLGTTLALGAFGAPRAWKARVRRSRTSEALAISRHLALERPHTAAHVLRSLPQQLRMQVIRAFDLPHRVAIKRVLDELGDD